MSNDSEFIRQDPHDLKPVEQTLAAFVPRGPRVDRDRLMFLAGSHSPAARRLDRSVEMRAKQAWLWPAATAAMTATSLALAVALFLRSEPRMQNVVRDSAPAAPTPHAEAVAAVTDSPKLSAPDREPVFTYHPVARQSDVPANNYLRTREVALRMGVEALGSPRSAGDSSAGTMTYIQWLAGWNQPATSPGATSTAPLPNM